QLEPPAPEGLELAEPQLVGAAFGRRQIRLRHRIEIVIGKKNEAESFPPERHHLAHHFGDGSLTRSLSIGSPHRTERAVLRTAAHGLNRSPHVAVVWQQVPPC